MGRARRPRSRQRGHLTRARTARARARRRRLARGPAPRRGAGARRVPRPSGARVRLGRHDRARPRGHARPPEPDPPRCAHAVRGHPAGLPRRPLPLARRRHRAGRAARHRVDAGRRDHGARASRPPAVRRAVPSRVGEHEARPRAARELPRPHASPPPGLQAGGRAGASQSGTIGREHRAAPPAPRGVVRARGRLRRAVRRPRPRDLARQLARRCGRRTVLLHRRAGRAAGPGRLL